MVYVTSDLHGYPLEKFKALLTKAGFSGKDELFVLGDVIDRGPDGIRLLRWLMLQSNAYFLLGNHEDMMLSCSFLLEEIDERSLEKLSADDLSKLSGWMANGATPTLQALHRLSPDDRVYLFEFLQDAPLYDTVCAGGRTYLLTHSGLGSFRPDKKMDEYSRKELLWNRPSISDRYFNDKTVVFGHTPTANYGKEYEGIVMRTDTWIDIDTGGGWGFQPVLLRLDDLREFYPDES